MQRQRREIERQDPDLADLTQIPAQDAEIGGTYLSRTGLRVIVKGRRDELVVLHSLATGHDVEVPPSYPLIQDGDYPVTEDSWEEGSRESSFNAA